VADGTARLIESLTSAFQKATAALATANAALDRVRALHPSYEEARARQNALCLECIEPAPCRTRRALDGEDSSRG
jgi:hypothetical protein